MPGDHSLCSFVFLQEFEVSRTTFQQHMWLFYFSLFPVVKSSQPQIPEKRSKKRCMSKAFLRANSHSLYGESSGSLKKTALERVVFLGCSSNCGCKIVSFPHVRWSNIASDFFFQTFVWWGWRVWQILAAYKCRHSLSLLDFKALPYWTGRTGRLLVSLWVLYHLLNHGMILRA